MQWYADKETNNVNNYKNKFVRKDEIMKNRQSEY